MGLQVRLAVVAKAVMPRLDLQLMLGVDTRDAVDLAPILCQAGRRPHGGWRVVDIGAAYATLRERGAAFRDAPHRVYTVGDVEGWMAFLEDPEGNTLALMDEQRVS